MGREAEFDSPKRNSRDDLRDDGRGAVHFVGRPEDFDFERAFVRAPLPHEFRNADLLELLLGGNGEVIILGFEFFRGRRPFVLSGLGAIIHFTLLVGITFFLVGGEGGEVKGGR